MVQPVPVAVLDQIPRVLESAEDEPSQMTVATPLRMKSRLDISSFVLHELVFGGADHEPGDPGGSRAHLRRAAGPRSTGGQV